MPKDQFGVADPDEFRDFDKRRTRAKSYEAMPAPSGEPWSDYMQGPTKTKKSSPTDVSSSDVVDTDEGRRIT